MKSEKQRYYAVDALRGLAIVNMILFHFLYDVFMIYGKNPAWYSDPFVHIWQQGICCTFIFVSGFVWQWGAKNNLRRGLFCNLCGIIISIVTLIAVPSEAVWFGILNFIGCAILIMIPLHKIMKKIPAFWGLGISFLLFIFFRQVQYGVIGIGSLLQISVPKRLYSIKLLTPFGFPFPGFSSGDYFPILPWLFLYLCGYFFNGIFQKHDSWQRAACQKVPFLSAIGQKSIWIYMIHQPVCMFLCMLLF